MEAVTQAAFVSGALMGDRLRDPEDFAQIAAELAVDLEESIRLSEERLRFVEESLRLVEESRRRRDELLQRMAQTVAVMQAEIVRTDETHS